MLADLEPRPIVLPRSQHCISRSAIDPDALKVLYRLHHNGYKAFLVGGSVRDLLLGKRPKDFDVATDAHPGEIRRLFSNCRIIGRRFRIAHIYFKGNKIIEVSTFRTHFAPFDERTSLETGRDHSDQCIYGQPHEDAFRRDITINGLFYDIATFTVLDYVGGLADLRNGLIRAIGDPDEKCVCDPVCMIRACRHAARTGFAIEPATYRAIRAHAPLIATCNKARLLDEFEKDLTSGSSRRLIELLKETGLLKAYIPAFSHYLDTGSTKQPAFFGPEWIWRALDYLDQRIREGSDTESTLCYVPILFPLLEQELGTKAASGNIPWVPPPVEPKAIVDTLKVLASPLGLPRRVIARLATTWAVLPRMEKAMRNRLIPCSLSKRPYFTFLLDTYRLIWNAAGVPAGTLEQKIRHALWKGRHAGTVSAKRKKSTGWRHSKRWG